MDLLTVNDRHGAYPDSYYAATAHALAPFPEAQGEMNCDVCVVGGGYTGLSTALHLAEKGYDVVLLDAQRVGWGASGRNGGQVGSSQRRDQDELETMVGVTHARELWTLSQKAHELVRSLIADHDIDCGYAPGIIHADHRQRYVKHSHTYVTKLQTDYGYDQIRALDRDEVQHLVGSPAYYGGSLDMGSGHLHPLNFALGLAQAARHAGVRIYECSRVTGIQESIPAIVKTATATITARFVALGCNGYLGNLKPHVAARVMPINNFIVATEPLGEDRAQELIRNNYAVADSRFVVNYFRLSQDNRMLFGGGESYSFRFPSDIPKLVSKQMLEVYPQLEHVPIDYSWGGTLGITMNRMPHFERINGNILSASGYSGQGVAMATFAGTMMADAVDGQAGAFDAMANVPTHRFPGGAVLRWPLLALAMTWYTLRDRL